MNGDGLADVLVGSPRTNDPDAGPNQVGFADLYLSTASGLPAAPSTTLATGVASETVGTETVASAGDVNGDGYGDAVIGAGTDGNFGGAVYVFLGGPGGLSPTPSTTLLSPTPAQDDGYASAVASAGDFNGDGYADIIVGASLDNLSAGRAYLYFGRASGLGTVPTPLNSTGTVDLGEVVSSAGDLNGDGLGDLIVSAPAISRPSVPAGGAVLVYLGSSSGAIGTPAILTNPKDAGADFGGSIAGAGDVNGDGYSDIVVEESDDTAYIFFGTSRGISTTPSAIIAEPFGSQPVAGAGDVNGDGYADIVLGAPNANDQVGRAYVYYGSVNGPLLIPSILNGSNAAFGLFGVSVMGAGDTNGDGLSDVVVSEPYDVGGGKVFVFLGGSGGVNLTGNPISQPTSEDTQAYGQSLALLRRKHRPGGG